MEQDEAEWVREARGGDSAAFGRLVSLHQKALFHFLLGQVREAAVADDLTQETFLRAWRALPGFRSESGFRTWLFQIGVNRARSWGRWRKLRLFWERPLTVREDEGDTDFLSTAPSPDQGPDAGLMQQDLSRRLRAAIDRLPPREKEVFLLRHDQDLPIKEIAQVLSIAEGSVKAHLFHALEKLRRDVEALQ